MAVVRSEAFSVMSGDLEQKDKQVFVLPHDQSPPPTLSGRTRMAARWTVSQMYGPQEEQATPQAAAQRA